MPQIQVLNPTAGFVEILLRHVMPLFKETRRSRYEQVGTGLLVKAGDNVFVVSAAHVLDQADKLFMYAGRATKRSLGRQLRLTPMPISGIRRDDKIDIGVIKLTRQNSSTYAEINKDAISFAKLKPRALPRDQKDYLLIGFPASRSKIKHGTRTLFSTPQAYFTSFIDYSLYEKLCRFPFEHIVLTYHPNDLIGLDGANQIAPPLQGMSGSPIFICGAYKDVSTIEEVAVAGIFIEQPRRSNALIGTDIFTAMMIIESFA